MEILCSIGHACGEFSREKGRLPFQCTRGVCVLPLLIPISLETGARRARGWSEARRKGDFYNPKMIFRKAKQVFLIVIPFFFFSYITLSVVFKNQKHQDWDIFLLERPFLTKRVFQLFHLSGWKVSNLHVFF